MIFVDANIFLEVMLNQIGASECQDLLKYLETARPCASISIFHVFAMILVIEHRTKDVLKAQTSTDAIYSYQGLTILPPSLLTLKKTFERQLQYKLDFDDAFVVASMEELNIQFLVTFDTHFDKVPSIKILTPQEALKMLTTPATSPPIAHED